MKKLIHKKWLSIPVTAFLVLVLTAGAVVAAGGVLPYANQKITQRIDEAEVVYDYGSITANTISLPSIEVGETFGYDPTVNVGTVTVEVGADGVDKYLHLELDKDSASLYDQYSVTLQSGASDNPMTETLALFVQSGSFEILDSNIQLTVAGTYTFNEYVTGTAGNTSGFATVKVTYTLEDTP